MKEPLKGKAKAVKRKPFVIQLTIATETPSDMLWCLARLKLAFKSALRE